MSRYTCRDCGFTGDDVALFFVRPGREPTMCRPCKRARNRAYKNKSRVAVDPGAPYVVPEWITKPWRQMVGGFVTVYRVRG